ncbi:nucleotide pyrophosphohydrolase MazG [Neokomagataea thailandica NBRC 106555]|uniref:Nucleoside triphosphate pyrophosphohydrolase n=2 Tax=Neokomagataea TaxID=1223423 RepID=A0A4Y6V3P5_9PROT|nr:MULTISPECIES: nucleoside triphosphate pyrophosphohydrolase [Neokomagataea]QDH24732.1 nucleoside triphosphate pyrophosphohydrolase [Neokomagataea tanensis]GBR53723.1 nucleotide pyrophosphohydrolase MazG [Neokomagataea thailandica NBRC 106555]
MTAQHAEERQIDRLLNIMHRLRDPQNGCPWDVAQTPATIAPFAIEEAYEVLDAISRSDHASLPDELGDLLFQVVFQAQMAQEAGLFNFDDVARTIADKMERRHPHIFSPGAEQGNWENIKETERRGRAEFGALAGIASSLPALSRAAKLCKRAERVGFDWDNPQGVLQAVKSELAELEAEMGGDHDRIEDELGDVLFSVASLARKMDIDPEAALRRSNAKFTRRFEAMETSLAHDGKTIAEQDLPTLEALWKAVKKQPGML